MVVQSAIHAAKINKEHADGVVERDFAVEKVGLEMGVMEMSGEKTIISVHLKVKKGGTIQIKKHSFLVQ